MKPNILITPQAFNILDHTIDDILSDKYIVDKTGGQIPNKNELIRYLKKYDGCVIGSEKVDKEVFDACPNLKILSRFGSGYNSIDMNEAKKNGVTVTIVPNSNPKAVARHALALLLSLMNNIIIQNEKLKNGLWEKSYNISPERNKIGIIGLGKIGFEFAKLCKSLGFDIHYFSRTNKSITGYTYHSSIKKLVRYSDILSLHLVSNVQTEGIIDAEIIELMSGKYLINTARASLLDENALYNSLKQEKMIGAGIDVYANEPYIGLSKKLAKLKNVIATSHTACYDYFSIDLVGKVSLKNIRYFFDGKMSKINKFAKI